MSISRKNWSALSSLARQWTMEDEEEVEREKRRRVRGSSSTTEADGDLSPPPTEVAASDSTPDTPNTPDATDSPDATDTPDTTDTTDSSRAMPQGLTSAEQMQVDFVEMLRVRNEKRRLRHVEALRRQKLMEEDQSDSSARGGGRITRAERPRDSKKEDQVFSPVATSPKPPSPLKTASKSPNSSPSGSPSTDTTHRQHENEECKDPEPNPSSNRNRKLVSSVSISLDSSRCTSPMSSSSLTPPMSPKERWEPTCQSPSPREGQSPVQNGHTEENGKSEQSGRPSLVRHSSRTLSFRMMRKKEEEMSPLQRSASVRMASKKFENNTEQHEDEDKPSSFQRNSRQRVSARSIQEKMERLAQAAQKSEMARPPDVTHRTLHLLDEVSRKRGIFEKEAQEGRPTSPGVSRHEFRSYSSGVSERINRWINKAKDQAVSPHSAADLKHVNINSKRSLFESISSK